MQSRRARLRRTSGDGGTREKLNSEVFPLLKRPTSPIFIEASCYHSRSRGPYTAPSMSRAILALSRRTVGANPVAIKLGLATSLRSAWPLSASPQRHGDLAYAVTTRRGDVSYPQGPGQADLVSGPSRVVQIALMTWASTAPPAAHTVIMVNSYAVHTVRLRPLPPSRRPAHRAQARGSADRLRRVVILFAPGSRARGDARRRPDHRASASCSRSAPSHRETVQRVDPVRLMMYQSIIGARDSSS